MFIVLQIFFATHAVLKIGECPRIFLSFSWGILGHVMCLDQCMCTKIYDGFMRTVREILV